MSCIVSGLSGTTETAQSQVSIGMGLLAGSTVMLLTVLWGSCVIVGKCDLVDTVAQDATDTKGFSLTGMYLRIVCHTSATLLILLLFVIYAHFSLSLGLSKIQHFLDLLIKRRVNYTIGP